jgi:4-amino-4-deoxy-L-arabinose transferase-like glycosyltransferase
MIFWLLLGLAFFAGLAVRLYDLGDPPLDFHPTRQLHSALIARGMYYENHDGIPAWQREMAVKQWRMEGIIEPQVMERLAAWSYAVVGSPDLRIPRLFAIVFWMAAAVFVALLTRDLIGPAGVLVAAVFFLAWPYGVIASRAFQPEPLMIALIAGALWAAVRWERSLSWRWAVLAGVLAGLAILIKSVAVFFIAPALAALVLSRFGLQAFRVRQVWVIALLSLLPVTAYYIDGVLLRGYLVSQFGSRFFPSMWLDPAFYLRWARNISRLMPFSTILISAAGVFLLQRAAHRAALLAFWAGYLVFGMALPHHISTHDYYHLPLAVPIAIGLGAIGQTVYANFRGQLWLVRSCAAALLLAALVFSIYDAYTTLKRFDGAAQARAWMTIGSYIGQDESTLALVPDYGSGLKYWAWVTPGLWEPRANLRLGESGEKYQMEAFQALLAEQAAGRHYFVVTWFDELARQPELRYLLFEHYTLLAESPDFLIFDLRTPRKN